MCSVSNVVMLHVYRQCGVADSYNSSSIVYEQ